MAGDRRSKQRKIRFNVLIIGLLVFSMLGSIAILTGVALKSQNNTLTESTLQSNFEGARNLNVTMNTLIDMMFRSLGTTAKFIAEREITLEQSSDTLRDMMGGQHYFNAVITVDGTGVIRSSMPESMGLTGQRINDPAALRALEERKPFITEPYTASTGGPVILVSHPVLDKEGQYRGFVGGFIYLQEKNVFSDTFNHAIRSKKGTFAYVVDRSGSLLYNPDDKRIGEVAEKDELRQKLMNGPVNYALITTANGRNYLAGFLIIPKIGWGVVFQTPAAAVNDAMKLLIQSQLTSIIPLFVLLLIISLWIARKLTVPFAMLTETARKISIGERVNDPPFTSHWNYEAHHLSRAMMRAVGGLQNQADQMTEEARTDKLTGLANRASLDERLAKWTAEGKPYTLLVLDIDHFKAVNDTYGHRIGDEALVHLAGILANETGEGDLCCRFGGEEFIVLLPAQSLRVGQNIAERIRRKMEGSISPTGNPITVSIGLAGCPEHGDDFNKVFEQADQALYNAKRSGRNLTITADELSFRMM
jgi:diguanylate cyclase (GGDEF)-like protein